MNQILVVNILYRSSMKQGYQSDHRSNVYGFKNLASPSSNLSERQLFAARAGNSEVGFYYLRCPKE